MRLLWASFVLLIHHVYCGRFLFLPSTLHPSHPLVISHLANELAKRGHQIEWIEFGPKESNQVTVKLNPAIKKHFYETSFEDESLHSLYVEKTHPHHTKVWQNDYEAENERTTGWLAGTRLCDNFLAKHKKEFDRLVHEKFDTLVVDDQFNPCGLLLAGLRGDVFVYWSMSAMRPESAWANQSPNPPSYLPVPGTKLTEDLSFFKRSFNLVAYLKALYTHQHIIQPRIDAVFQKYYKGAASAFDLERNASINLVNTPPIFDFARPFMPRVNFVGGLHAKNASELHGTLGMFVDEAEEGFMLVTSGLELDWGKAPSFLKEAFIGAFQAHPRLRFIWQYNGPEIELLPVNVFTTPFLPQQDLLGHKKCKAHITVGGLNSVIESVWHGKPMIGLPLTVHNYDNVLRVSSRGAGILIPKQNLQLGTLKKAITNIQKKKYSDEMAIFQDMVRDVPYTELTHAAFWVEFIERHHEVPHARSGADKLNIFQYFLVDVLAFLASIVLLIIATVLLVIRTIFRLLMGLLRRLFGRSTPAVTKEKKRN
ncbi:unnamed protein product, partial [Mesorhabditis belari]|uniref:glucuronosyltransferase n=1 Tax=Mesorhabditis belari TaxID=2138241 RepID=A0AAF3J2J9_9BILA